MKKQEMEQLSIGTIVANKLAQYTITKIEEIDGAKVFTLDDIRTAKETTMKRNYTLVKLAEQESETEETTEQEQVTIDKVLPTIEEIEAVASKIVIADIDEPEVQPAIIKTKKVNKEKAEQKAEEPEPEVKSEVKPESEAKVKSEGTSTKMTKKQAKAEAKAKIEALNKTITDAIDADLRGNLSYIVDDRKGRTAIKIKPIDELKPRVILDLVLNSKGAKAHVRREAISNIEYYRAKNMTKALPEKWALNLEVQIDSLDTFWDLIDQGLDFELDRIQAKMDKLEEKKQATA